MNGAIMIVAIRSLGFSIVRVAIIPGTAQAKLLSKGTNAFPCNPTARIRRSIRKAARAMYPLSSRMEIKRNSSRICGRNASTPPTPAIIPSARRSVKMPAGRLVRAAWSRPLKMLSIRLIGRVAHEKIAWKTSTITASKMIGPSTLCVTKRSIFSLRLRRPSLASSTTSDTIRSIIA